MEDFHALMQTGIQRFENDALAGAESLFRSALEIRPKSDDALQLLGLTLFRQGNALDGEQLIRLAIRLNPQNIRARNNLASMLKDLGRLQESSAEFQQLYVLAPEDSGVCANLATVLNELGQYQDALRFSVEAISKAPQWGHTHLVHGLVLKNTGDLQGAQESVQQALKLEPGNPEFNSNLSSIFLEQEEYEEAERAARASLAVEPDRADAHHNLGIALARQYAEVEAIRHLNRAIELAPRNAKAYCDLATSICDQGRLDEALELYKQAQTINPTLGIARFGLAILQLTKGDFANGWINYEARKVTPELHASTHEPLAPNWNGESLQGKRLLVCSEQGLGDILQFVRFVPRLLEMGAYISLEAPPELSGLLKDTQWPVELITMAEAEHENFDFECSLLSIPKVLKITVEDLPGAIAYLKSNPDKLAYWQEKLGERHRPRIGLCWAGSATHKNDHNRSIEAELFSRLCVAIDADFISLQRDPYENELQDFSSQGIQLINWTDEFFNLAETAALVDCLDLVISVDTVIAHLAGGLGKTTWTLIPYVPDWRWLERREDSPWYPGMRLFRQASLGNWESVITQVRTELAGFINSANS
jgi:Flp pilus assembly protein TadD